MLFNLSFMLALSTTQSLAAKRPLPINIIMSPAWTKDQYQSLTTELELYNIRVNLYSDPSLISEAEHKSHWLYHGLAGPYHQLYYPENACGLILVGVPTQVPQNSVLPNIPLPDPAHESRRWLDDWRKSQAAVVPLPNTAILVLSSSKDYLAPPEYSYRNAKKLDFVRFSPINALPEPTHLQFIDHPITARLIGRWIHDHPCSF